jgi:hypothetical protein
LRRPLTLNFVDDKSPSEHPLHGLPQTPHSPLTPLGEIEQFGKIADGLRARREGWRKWVVRIGIVLIAGSLLATLIARIVLG